MKRTITLLCMAVLSFTVLGTALHAQVSVAVINFDGNNFVNEQQAAFMTTMFRSELVKSGRVEVVDRANMDRIISELRFQQTDWVNPERVKRFGQMIGADYLITGSFEALGRQFYLAVQMLDIETARIIHSSRLTLNALDEYETRVAGFAGEFARQFPQGNRFAGEWEGSIDGYDFNIVFLNSNQCRITITATQPDGSEITAEVNGTWSADENIIRINATVPSSAGIRGLRRINWSSVYTFTNAENSAFNMMITPPNSNRQVRISFMRTFT